MMIARYWYGLPKVAYDHAVCVRAWQELARAITAVVGVLIAGGSDWRRYPDAEGLGLLAYITAYPAFMVATYLGGAWTGLLTIVLGGLGTFLLLVPPYDLFGLSDGRCVVHCHLYNKRAGSLALVGAPVENYPSPLRRTRPNPRLRRRRGRTCR